MKYAASDLADWWDGQHKESKEFLEEWVMENPQWWAIGVATATGTAMDLGKGMVDVLRLGEGAAKGGWGYGEDALRLLQLAGPFGKVLGKLGTAKHVAQMGKFRYAVTPPNFTGPCTFKAVNNAVSIVSGGKGRNIFLTIREAAKALGQKIVPITSKGKYSMGAWVDDLVPFLKSLGIKIRSLGKLDSIDDIANAARTRNGVVIFAIKWVNKGKEIGHSMIAVRGPGGRVWFADYGQHGFMRSLAELANRGGKWVPDAGTTFEVWTTAAKGESVLVQGAHMTAAAVMQALPDSLRTGATLAMGLTAIDTPDGVDVAVPMEPSTAMVDKEDLEVAKASFEAFKERKKKGRAPARLPKKAKRKGGVPRAEYLTGVQYRLNAAGFGAGPVDGINGPKTKSATRRFQKAYGLRVDTIPGPKTQAKLVEVCGY